MVFNFYMISGAVNFNLEGLFDCIVFNYFNVKGFVLTNDTGMPVFYGSIIKVNNTVANLNLLPVNIKFIVKFAIYLYDNATIELMHIESDLRPF